MITIVQQILKSIKDNSKKNAFCIEDVFYTYNDLATYISKIQYAIQTQTSSQEINFGLIVNNDLETYATIIALWLEGKAYVPINPEAPLERNINIIEQSKIKTIIDSTENFKNDNYRLINSGNLPIESFEISANNINESNLAYILFTSGTTGSPKGVPITLSNLIHFAKSMNHLGYKIQSSDRCLQMFELTFDFSVVSYLIPLLNGACIYTVSKHKIKYLEIYRLIKDYNLTILPMVPSILNYLRPFFKKIKAPSVRFNIFCGEALDLDIIDEWFTCVSNSNIINFYGPTEATVFCTYYEYKPTKTNKAYNGVMCIGKPMKYNDLIIIDENNKVLGENQKGELCISGKQLTNGYWDNNELNKKSFFHTTHKNELKRFYKTGDECFFDKDFDIMYVSRIDFQAKIQGYRVELSEVEYYSKKILSNLNLAAVIVKNKFKNNEIALAIEGSKIETKNVLKYLKTKLPDYMIPTKIIFFDRLPLNLNGKTDRKKISTLIESNYE